MRGPVEAQWIYSKTAGDDVYFEIVLQLDCSYDKELQEF